HRWGGSRANRGHRLTALGARHKKDQQPDALLNHRPGTLKTSNLYHLPCKFPQLTSNLALHSLVQLMARTSSSPKKQSNGANLGFEQKLWQAADKLRGHMDAAEYKHVVLGLIFLKYISDAFEEKHSALLKVKGADPEDRDEYLAENIFWVPKQARWSFIQAKAKQTDIGKVIDDAMTEIEKKNPQLKGVLSKDYARPALDKQRLGELIDLIGTIGLGDKENRSKDIL